MKSKVLQKLFSVLLVFCIVFGMCVSVTYAQTDPFQNFILSAMLLPEGTTTGIIPATEKSRYSFVEFVLKPLLGKTHTADVTDALVDEAYFIFSSNITKADIKLALEKYVPYSNLKKSTVNDAIKSGLVSISTTTVGISNFQSIANAINNAVTDSDAGTIPPNSGNNYGLSFMVTMLATVMDLTGNTAIARDLSSDDTKIDFIIPTRYSDTVDLLLSPLIDTVVSITSKISGTSGDSSFEKLLNYTKERINSKPEVERSAFKAFLYANGGLYTGLHQTFSTGGSSTTGGGGGGGGGSPEQTIDTSNKVLNNIDKNAPPSEQTVNNALGLLDISADAISRMSDPIQAMTKAEDLIKSAANLITALNAAGESTTNVENALLKVAESALDRVNSQSATPTIKGTVATVDMSQTSFDTLISTIDSKAKELDNALSGAGVTEKVEKVLDIKVAAASGTSEVDVKLPQNIFAADNKAKIDKVDIETSVATFAIDPGSITSTGTGPVSLSAKKLDSADFGGSPAFEFNGDVGGQPMTFNPPIEISIPYSGTDTDNVTVYLVHKDANGNIISQENVIGIYDAATKTVKFTTPHFSTYVIKQNKVSFNDVTSNNWYTQYVLEMASKGIISGMGEGKFDPSANVTRAQFASMVVRAFKLTDSSAVCSFSDVKKGDWYYTEVASAVKAGIISGKTSSTFAPNENISRQDMAVIIAKTLIKVKNKTAVAEPSKFIQVFKDKDSIAEYAKASVAQVVKAPVMSGLPGSLFAPKDLSTRAQAATVIYKLLYLN